ncbi:HNH endonuclease [Microbispora sp. NBC_01189]|uniref:HNH endonuclease n=1 Tax=Microbispora sp. NBC_01189 TaxID=2903583 RepID=UPI002E10DDB2|nr:HNH endonuclease [Microbispora sp. NBC_01189]
MRDLTREFTENRYHRTYLAANTIDKIATNPFGYLHTLEEIFVNDGIVPYLAPFQKCSALHRFAYDVIWQQFYDHLMPPVTLIESDRQKFDDAPLYDATMRVLPIEVAFEEYELEHMTFNDYRAMMGLKPLKPGFHRHVRADDHSGCNDDCVAINDDYGEYWNELLLAEPSFETLLNRMSDEIFFVMFSNRSFLARLNNLLSNYVQDAAFHEDPEVRKFFSHKSSGSHLKRCNIPTWAKRAVEFRDRGMCTYCQRQLGTLHTPISHANFDHVVPLAKGGLNDVTNLQLLCDDCNGKKHAGSEPPGILYQRWYPV